MSRSKSSIDDVIIEERDVGYLDPGIEAVLRTLNSLEGVSTTSSCIGRVALVEGKYYWGRDEDSRIIYKTHGRITGSKILEVLSRGFSDVWLRASGPILHLRVSSIDCALHILGAARPYGFKHSGIIAVGEDVVVELMSAAQMSMPLRVEGRTVVRTDPGSLEALAGLANSVVEEGRSRLYRLASALSSSPGPCSQP